MIFKWLQILSDKLKISCSIKLPDSREIKFGEQYGSPLFQVDIKTKKGLRALLSGNELKIAEAYIYKDIDLNEKVDMLKLFAIKNFFSRSHPFIIQFTRIISFFSNQVVINKKSISRHYEFDNDFYLLFLDKTRTYSHGIFIADNESHELAATRKLEFALNSCHLMPGAKVLDIGAGWGNIVEFLGTRGFHVDALTLSNQSERFVLQLIENKKLFDCRVFKKDFLEYELPSGETYDALFSLGTLEHLPNYKKVLQRCSKFLKKGGYAYFDASASVPEQHINSDFIERHIFPGNHTLLDIFRFLDTVKNSSFELVSLHNDRHSYYLTLKAWAQNVDAHKQEIITRWGETIYRKFQLYFWGCCYSMLNNELQAYRIVLRKV
jgi:cyclopropane-fatty-acyl-phospholipid synthase